MPEISQETYAKRAEAYWTEARRQHVMGAKNLLLELPRDAWFLKTIGLLDDQGKMERAHIKKFHQINHLLRLIQPELDALAKQFSPLRILDVGCGNSYLSFLLAWYGKTLLRHEIQVVGIDHRADVIARSSQRAAQLGWQEQLRFVQADFNHAFPAVHWLGLAFPEQEIFKQTTETNLRFHFVAALHACDTATDQAMAFGIQSRADLLAVAPCCQAELARNLGKQDFKGHPLETLFATPNFCRESAALLTDNLRVLLARSHGYETTVTEFVESVHTPKNRLIKGVRRARFHEGARKQYEALRSHLKVADISLAEFLRSGSATES